MPANLAPTRLPTGTASSNADLTALLGRLRVVHVRGNSEGGNLFLQDGSQSPIQLTDSGQDRAPVLSDDGQKIVFYRGPSNETVYAINADGSDEQAIITSSELSLLGRGNIQALTFIPGTHILLFNTYHCDPSVALYNAPDCAVGIYSVNTDSGEINRLLTGLSGNRTQDRNFEISPEGRYLSAAASGHVDLYYLNPQEGTLGSGMFRQSAILYWRTQPDEFLPFQYWLPDSSGLIVGLPTDPSNEPATPPSTFAIWRYTIQDNSAVQIPLPKVVMRDWYSNRCFFSVSPDRNWILFLGTDTGNPQESSSGYLGDLRNGHVKSSRVAGGPCDDIRWSPDSKHVSDTFAVQAVIESVDGSSIQVGGQFGAWIDASHYLYYTGVTANTFRGYIGEIGGAALELPQGFTWSETFVVMPPASN